MAQRTVKKKETGAGWRVVTVALFLIAVLTAVGVFLIPLAAQGVLEKNLTEITGLPLKIGDLHFDPFRLQLTIQGLEFSNPADFPVALLTQIGAVRMHYAAPPTWVGPYDLKRVEIDFNEFRLVRNESGVLNLPRVEAPLRVKDPLDEVVINFGSLTYTDLTGEQPVQETFDLNLEEAVYRNVKGIAGILEILYWEVLKRTGVEEKTEPALPLKPTDESPVEVQIEPEPAARVSPESTPAPLEPSPAPLVPEAD